MARRRKPVTGWKAAVLILLLLVFYLYEEGYFDRFLDDIAEMPPQSAPRDTPASGGEGAEHPGEAPQLAAAASASGSWYQVYFTRPFYPERPANRHGGVDAALAADIDAAQRSVDMAVFDLDVESLAEALLRAVERGVQVRLVVDDVNLEDPDVAELTGRLEQAGVGLTFDRREPFMHIKMMIVDDRIVWTGSMNFTVNDVYRNNNNMLRFAIPELTTDYKRRFEWLFAGRGVGESSPPVQHAALTLPGDRRIENFFSPRGGGAAAIEERLRGAQSSIRMMSFSYTSDEQGQILIDQHQAGLTVQAVMESRNAAGTGSEFDRLAQAGVPIFKDGNCYIMHNKVYIIDDRTVITGSYNFTASAERSNDENLLIIDDPELARLYVEEFQRIYDHAQNPTTCGG